MPLKPIVVVSASILMEPVRAPADGKPALHLFLTNLRAFSMLEGLIYAPSW